MAKFWRDSGRTVLDEFALYRELSLCLFAGGDLQHSGGLLVRVQSHRERFQVGRRLRLLRLQGGHQAHVGRLQELKGRTMAHQSGQEEQKHVP